MSLKRQTAQQTTLHSEHSPRIGLLTSTEDFEASWNSRQVEHDVDETTKERSSTPHGKDSIDKTTKTVIDTVGEADDKRLISLDQWSGCKNDTLHWARTDGIHPSCNHPSEATNQIASACKAKNYIHRSTAAQRERRPRASEKRQHLLPSQDIEKVTEKPFKFHIFFLPSLRRIS